VVSPSAAKFGKKALPDTAPFAYLRHMQFADIEGHHLLKRNLRLSVHENRIAHAQLFTGPEGSGALPLAIAYAQYIACEQRTEEDSCGHCPSCKKFLKLQHPDLHFSFPVIKPDKSKGLSDEHIGTFREALQRNPYMGLSSWMDTLDAGNKQFQIFADEAHEIIRKLTLVSVEGGYKFMIIWLPEKMRQEASNRLLKTLEEPTEKTLLMLVTENPDEVLGTIFSRCQLHRINAFSINECARVLGHFTQLDQEACLQLAEISEGNAAQAFWLLENQHEAAGQLSLFRDWMLACYQFHIKNLMNLSDQFQKKGREWQRGFLSYALFMIRQTMLQNHQPNLTRMRDDEKAFIEKFARFFHPGNYAEISGYINTSSLHIKGNGNGKIIFFDTSLQISDVFRKEKNAVAKA
jgi:DNA polymerase-3 subunit delta'